MEYSSNYCRPRAVNISKEGSLWSDSASIVNCMLGWQELMKSKDSEASDSVWNKQSVIHIPSIE